MTWRRRTVFLLLLAVCAASVAASRLLADGKGQAAPVPDGEQRILAAMRAAAVSFLDSLDDDVRSRAVFALDDDERRQWSNLPATMFERKGVSFGEMSVEQRALAHQLIRSPLSSQGYLKAAGIMRIDEILKEYVARSRPEASSMFGQDKYWIGIFGDPKAGGPWGWQLDGHHLALNFTVVDGEISVTPAFLGSDPAEIRTDLDAGWYVLAKEDVRGRRLFESLGKKERAKALLEGETPSDVIAGPGRADRLKTISGLAARDMTDAQRALLRQLVHEYLDNLEPDLAEAQAARVEAAGFDELHFSWAGTETDKPYYYRIHGPTLLIEFDNNYPPGRSQGAINHIHTVWRDTERDYGDDLLRRHYEESPHHEKHDPSATPP
jgi:hypothetical protein